MHQDQRQRPFDIFLSYSSADEHTAGDLARALGTAGLAVWLDKTSIGPGERWQDGLESGIRAARIFLCLIGKQPPGGWQDHEIRYAQQLHISGSDQAPQALLTLRLDGGPDGWEPGFLGQYQFIDLTRREGLLDPASVGYLMRVLRDRLAPPRAPREPVAEPFRGLAAYREEHADIFFGRDAETDDLLARLQRCKWLVVHGESGSGKSSLVRAGLMSRLCGSTACADASPAMLCACMRPGSRPLDELASALAEAIEAHADAAPQLRGFSALRGFLVAQGPDGLSHLTRELGRPLLLVVDQFEELLLPGVEAGAEAPGAAPQPVQVRALLCRALADRAGPMRLVVSIRSDLIGLIGRDPGLAEALNDRRIADSYLLAPLDRWQLRYAIERALERADGGMESPALLDRILDDAQSGGAVPLPLVSHALQQTWRHTRSRGRRLVTAADYADNSVRGALTRSAEELFEGLGPDQRDLVRRVFLELIQPGRDGGADVKRPRAWGDLVARLGPAVEPVLRRLTGLRDGDDLPGEETAPVRLLGTRTLQVPGDPSGTAARSQVQVEVIHDALIDSWPRLRNDWLAAARQDLIRRDDIEHNADIWLRAGESPDALPSRGQLEVFTAWAAEPLPLGDGSRRYLAAAKAHLDRRARQRTTWLVGAVALLSALAIGLALALVEQGRQTRIAQTQTQIAQTQTQKATAQEQAALAQARNALEARIRQAEGLASTLVQQGDLSGALTLYAYANGIDKPGAEAVTAEPVRDLRLQLLAGLIPDLEHLILTDGPIHYAALLPGEREVLTVSEGHGIDLRRWDIETGKPVGPRLGPALGSYVAAGLSPDGTRVALVHLEGQGIALSLWDLAEGRRLALVSALGYPRAIDFSADGDRLLVASWGAASLGSPDFGQAVSDGVSTLALYRAADLGLVAEPTRINGSLTGADLDPAGSLAVVAGSQVDAVVWDLAQRRALFDPTPLPTRLASMPRTVTAAAFSPDGSQAAFADELHRVTLRESQSGVPVGGPIQMCGGVERIIFDAQFDALVLGLDLGAAEQRQGGAGQVAIWSPKEGVVVSTIAADSQVTALEVRNPLLAMGLADGSVAIRDYVGQRQTTDVRHSGAVTFATVTADRARLITGAADGSLRIWGLRQALGGFATADADIERNALNAVSWVNALSLTGSGKGEPWGPFVAGNRHLGLSRDARLLVATRATETGFQTRVWNLADRLPLGPPLTSDRSVDHALIAPRGDRAVAIGGYRHRVLAVDSAQFAPASLLYAAEGNYSTPCTEAAPGTAELRLWTLASGAQLGAPIALPGPVTQARFSADGTRLLVLSCSADRHGGELRVFDAADGTLRAGPMDTPLWWRDALLSDDNRRLLTLDGMEHAQLWDIAERPPAPLGPRFGKSVSGIALSPDGRLAAIAASDNRVALWEPASPARPRHLVAHDQDVTVLAFSPDGARLLVASADGRARLWRAADGRPLGAESKHAPVATAAFDPSGLVYVTGHQTGEVLLWDGNTGAALSPPFPFVNPYTMDRLYVAEHGRRIAVATRPEGDSGIVLVARSFVTGASPPTAEAAQVQAMLASSRRVEESFFLNDVDWARDLVALDGLIEQQPDNPSARARRGEERAARRESAPALPDLDAAIAGGMRGDRLPIRRAEVLFDLGRFREAAEALDGVPVDPTDMELTLLRAKALALAGLGQWADARAELRTVRASRMMEFNLSLRDGALGAAAQVRFLSGDADGVKGLCAEVADVLAADPSPDLARRTALVCLPPALGGMPAERWARALRSAIGQTPADWAAELAFGVALLDQAPGDAHSALVRLLGDAFPTGDAVLTPGGRLPKALPLFYLAEAARRQGELMDADKALVQARSSLAAATRLDTDVPSRLYGMTAETLIATAEASRQALDAPGAASGPIGASNE